jgi:tetratricopeptide (TPR) repeat protein
MKWVYTRFRFLIKQGFPVKKGCEHLKETRSMSDLERAAAMNRISVCVLPLGLLLLLLWATPALAQQDYGEVAFVNSGPAAAQADFLHGLAQLHNFEYDDAAEHFRKAQQIAPDFALAYWGEAMTKNHPLWHEEDVSAARVILKRLGDSPDARLAKAGTEREKLYLRSIEVMFGEGTKEERDRRYEAVLAELHLKFPGDVDGTAFYALGILGTAEHGRDFATYMRAAAVLEEVFPQHPRHPGVVHYLIHSYDDSIHAPLGLRAARIYAKIAPEAGHAQHMTSHIFLALGMWDDEVKANEVAVAMGNRLREKAGRPPIRCGHYNEWLEYGYMQQGRVADARRVLEGCRQAVERTAAAAHDNRPAGNTMEAMMSSVTLALRSYAEMRANFLIDSQLWNDDVLRATLPAGDYPVAQLTFDYTNALAAIRRGDLAAARDAAARAETDRQRALAKWKEQKHDEPEGAQRLLILTEQLQALLTAAGGKTQDAITELKRIAAKEHALPLEFGPPSVYKPTDELLGELLVELHRPSEAREAFQVALARAPGRRSVMQALARTDKEIAAK